MHIIKPINSDIFIVYIRNNSACLTFNYTELKPFLKNSTLHYRLQSMQPKKELCDCSIDNITYVLKNTYHWYDNLSTKAKSLLIRNIKDRIQSITDIERFVKNNINTKFDKLDKITLPIVKDVFNY